MRRCLLEDMPLDRLLGGEASAEERGALARHLEEECASCERVLEAASLDEATLLLLLRAPAISAQEQADARALWPRVEQALAAPAGATVISLARRKWILAATALAAGIAGFGVLSSWPPRPSDDGSIGSTGLKGDAPPAQVELRLVGLGLGTGCLPNGALTELRYDLDREAHLYVLHQDPEGRSEILYASGQALAPKKDGVFEAASGHLGYRFDDEPGDHRFVLAASDVRLEPREATTVLATTTAEGASAVVIDGRSVGLFAVRICASGGEP
ncbi:MAG: hypothetical protein IT384_18070 [Deltaproteobacteria bacterium]|nr:hypothetical protein [Deltaproteobacteria bacterium]